MVGKLESLRLCVIASIRFFIEAKQSAKRDGELHKPNTPADCFGSEKVPRNDVHIKQSFLLILILSIFSLSANAKILLPQIFGNDMVLQREQSDNILGFASSVKKVTLNFGKQTKTTITDAEGNGMVALNPLKISAVPQQMKIIGGNQIILKNILVGEVWLCSGLSNMEYAVGKLLIIPTPKNEALCYPNNELYNAKNTQIGIFLVNRKALIKPDSIDKSWAIDQKIRQVIFIKNSLPALPFRTNNPLTKQFITN